MRTSVVVRRRAPSPMSSHGFGRLDDAFGRGAALVDAMATTLADSFLADLDDLSDEDNDERGMIDASGAQSLFAES